MWTLIVGVIATVLLVTSIVLWVLTPRVHAAEGAPAPDFSLRDQRGTARSLGDYAGRWLVLYFYPRDATPLCTREACAFRDAHADLAQLDAAVVGVSVDSEAAHARFADAHALPFPLLSDPGGRIAARYGSLLNLGLVRLARRRTFVIGPDGRIAARFDGVDPDRHAAQVREVLARLQRSQVGPGLAYDGT